MKSKILLIAAIIGLAASVLLSTGVIPASAQTGLAQKLSGKILLQVEFMGEAWYVSPTDQKRYFLGRPADAFALMQRLALGTSNADLNKIPLGLLDYIGIDDDHDGLPNDLEKILGTDSQKSDSDADGYDDKLEMQNSYNPVGQGQILIDKKIIERLRGKILLQVESFGAGWYLNPSDDKKYYLGRPADAWQIMRRLALGITNANLEQIAIGQIEINPPPVDPLVIPPVNPPVNPPINQGGSVLDQAAQSIRNNRPAQAKMFFIESMRKSIEYSVEHLSAESRLLLANILSGSKLTSSTETEKVYTNKAYFSLRDQEVSLNFRVKKQSDGSWLIANL